LVTVLTVEYNGLLSVVVVCCWFVVKPIVVSPFSAVAVTYSTNIIIHPVTQLFIHSFPLSLIH